MRGGGHHVHRPAVKCAGPDGRQAQRQGHRAVLRRSVIPGVTEPLKDAAEALEKPSPRLPVIRPAAAADAARAAAIGRRKLPRVRARQERGEKAFGNDDIFIEKYLVEPKHVEVQILADTHGNVVHLYERDCSLQRRYQKVVEFAPAFSIPQDVREKLYEDAVKIAKKVGYVSAGTVEFLVDKSGSYYFIEMNPRIQVEHTVTEMVTGIDIVRAQILIAEGHPLSHPDIGITAQSDIRLNGYALQCRVTTEDPANNFAPDTGKITSYRSGGGVGVRLDGGNAATGVVISPYYDSLLVKVTVWDNTFAGVCRRAVRAINELHIRGVKTNIPFVTNILHHPVFLSGNCHTKFIDNAPELFEFAGSRDRGTRLLRFIAKNQVSGSAAEKPEYEEPRIPEPVRRPPPPGLKQLLDEKGPEAVRDWVLAQKKLLIGDTTMRDAHQSLFSTRMRTIDMVNVAEATADILADAFALEMWGGATFDVAPTASSTKTPGSGLTGCARKFRTSSSRCSCAAPTPSATRTTPTTSCARSYRRPPAAASTCSASSTRSTGFPAWKSPWTRS